GRAAADPSVYGDPLAAGARGGDERVRAGEVRRVPVAVTRPARIGAVRAVSGKIGGKELAGRGRPGATAVHADDRVAVDGEGERLAHADVVEGRNGRVQLEPFGIG